VSPGAPPHAPLAPNHSIGCCRYTGRAAPVPRRARRKGGTVAVFATARHLARLVYRMLRYGTDYLDEGEYAYDSRFRARRLAHLTRAAQELDYQLLPKEAA
jgi:hypothetical protein